MTTPQVNQISEDLKSVPRWVLWTYVDRGGKRTKAPINPATGNFASSTDPATWSTFPEAVAAWEMNPSADGLGFVLGDGWAGVDIDDCIDEKGYLHPEARKIVDTLDSYTEVSPSGRGIKIFLRAFQGLADHHRRKRGDWPAEGMDVEVYTEGRYFTVTGRRVAGTPLEVNERTSQLLALADRMTPAQEPQKTIPHVALPLSDQELLDKARNSAQGKKFSALYDRGDWASEGYPSQSEADQALCNQLAFWFQADPGQIDAAFRGSALMREKWGRSVGRGETYGQRTIARACESCGETYTPPASYSPTPSRERETDAKELADELSGGPRWRFPRNDLENAQLLHERHGADIRYTPATRSLYTWGGKSWKLDEGGVAVTRRASAQAALLLEEAATDKEKRWANKSCMQPKIKAAIDLLKSRPGVAVSPSAFDANPALLNCRSGTIDLRTGEHREHRRGDLLTKMTPVTFDSRAQAPSWEAFLRRVLRDDSERIAFAQRAVGYSLTGWVREHVVLILLGPGGNGKGVFIETILSLLAGYGLKASFATFVHSRNLKPSEPTPHLADLCGRRAVFASESDEGARLNEPLIKELSGGDTINARELHGKPFQFKPQHKIWLVTNHRPRVQGDDQGIWRRLLLLNFDVSIPESEQDPRLLEKLRGELPGILNWALEGCKEWQRIGLAPPDSVRADTNLYRNEEDPLFYFLRERCAPRPARLLQASATDLREAGYWVEAGQLYETFSDWAKASGETTAARWSKTKLTQKLKNRIDRDGTLYFPYRSRERGWAGLRLLRSFDPPKTDAEAWPEENPLDTFELVDTSKSQSVEQSVELQTPMTTRDKVSVDTFPLHLEKNDSHARTRAQDQDFPENGGQSVEPPVDIPGKGLQNRVPGPRHFAVSKVSSDAEAIEGLLDSGEGLIP